MKIALLYPGIVLEGFAKDGVRPKTGWIHHGLCYISSALKEKGHEVSLIDLRQLSGWDELPNAVRVISPNVVGITVMSLDFDAAVKSAEIIKQIDSSIKIVVGGAHATLMEHELIDKPAIDYVFKGEAEITFPKIIEDIAQGVINEKVITGEIPDLDKIPFMDRSLYKVLQVPMVPYLKMPFISTMAGRGCTYNCNFCQPAERKMFGKKVRRISPERLIEELEILRNSIGFNSFMLHDDCLLEDAKWVNRFLALYSQKRFKKPFICQGRADIIVRHPRLVKAMAKHGLELIGIGFESGSQRMLNFLRKGTTVEMNYKAARICNRYGVRIFANFMLGMPTETKEEVLMTVKMIKRIKPYVASPSFYTPSPGSDLYDYCVENDLSLITKHEDYLRSPEGAKIKGQDYEFLRTAAEETLKIPYSLKLRRKRDKLRLRHFNKDLIAAHRL